jgi:hypothetical protein
LHRETSLQDEEEIVRIGVLMPNELAFYFHHHEVTIVELTDGARLKVVGKRREFVREIYRIHRYGVFVDKIT